MHLFTLQTIVFKWFLMIKMCCFLHKSYPTEVPIDIGPAQHQVPDGNFLQAQNEEIFLQQLDSN